MRGMRGAREEILPQTTKKECVADVAIPQISSVLAVAQTTHSYFEVRKKCVLSNACVQKHPSQSDENHINRGIVNLLLPSILGFLTVFSFIGDLYGNDS
jgi:hypothetical protein